MKLTIEAIPQPAWSILIFLHLKPTAWDKFLRACFARAGYRCEICRAGPMAGLHCHGIWEYHDESGVQKLARCVVLCDACHEVKHYGRACVTGRASHAQRHFLKVNDCTLAKMCAHIDEARARSEERSKRAWTLDLSWFDRFNERSVPDGAQ